MSKDIAGVKPKESKVLIPCPACDGAGGFEEIDYVPGCCGDFKNGECCGDPEPTPNVTVSPCSYCGGLGKVPENHLEL